MDIIGYREAWTKGALHATFGHKEDMVVSKSLQSSRMLPPSLLPPSLITGTLHNPPNHLHPQHPPPTHLHGAHVSLQEVALRHRWRGDDAQRARVAQYALVDAPQAAHEVHAGHVPAGGGGGGEGDAQRGTEGRTEGGLKGDAEADVAGDEGYHQPRSMPDTFKLGQ